MFNLKNRMLKILIELRDQFSAFAVKADFEAEGVNLSELIFLNELVCRANLKLFLKIGGCEAIFDLNKAKLFGAQAVMVPVIESEFALKKFQMAFKQVYSDDEKQVEKILNAETKTCAENFDHILKQGENFLDAVTIGRVDLAASLGLNRTQINSELILNYCVNFFNKAKNNGLIIGLGGGLNTSSFEFLQKIQFDRFETRKIVFKNKHSKNKAKFSEAIYKATEFELCCLKFKHDYFTNFAREDEIRLTMLKNRLGEF